ncbi:MAG: type II secretion system F family protein [Candidatus Aenigmarchaeota archaeon]|nr:type II secretion system F family protein [Candidatus Aenigmarchaeota archaeon]
MARIELEKRQKIMLGTTVFSVLLIVIGIVIGDPALIINLVIISVFAFIVQFFLYKYSYYMWVKSIEDQFPKFVRNMADNLRSGMSFKEALNIATKSDYGKLTEEVKRMASKMNWGIDFQRAMDIFAAKVRRSRMITEAIAVMKEAYKNGGAVANTFDSIARDMIMLKEIEAERESMMRQQVMTMYGIFIMFLGIAVVTIFVMVPMIKTQPDIRAGGTSISFSDPCLDSASFPCNLFSLIGLLLNIPKGIALYYTSLFFSVSLILAVLIGLIAGQVGENSITAGSKHSIIMVTLCLSVFMFLAKSGLLPK